MSKIFEIIKILTLQLFISMSLTALAVDETSIYSNYKNEGELLFKIRGFYSKLSSKPKGFPSSVATAEKPGSLVETSYGIDAATQYFFNDNIAAELSTGVGILRVKKTRLITASKSLGDGTGTIGTNNDIYMIPVAATIQYHIAPFGAIRPYVGVGYHGTYMYTGSKAIKVTSGHGPVAQIGVDFFAKDDTFFNLDLRQYFLKTNVTFRKEFLTPNNPLGTDIRSKVNWNPLVLSFGIGFKF